jgi:hypothetical protein
MSIFLLYIKPFGIAFYQSNLSTVQVVKDGKDGYIKNVHTLYTAAHIGRRINLNHSRSTYLHITSTFFRIFSCTVVPFNFLQ